MVNGKITSEVALISEYMPLNLSRICEAAIKNM